MRDEVKSCLEDILHSIELINSFIGSVRKFEDYRVNLIMKNAVERRIEIIGEALNKGMKSDNDCLFQMPGKLLTCAIS